MLVIRPWRLSLASMLHGRRTRLQRLAQAEVEGETIWTTNFDQRARVRISTLIGDLGVGVKAMMRGEVDGLMQREMGISVIDFDYSFGSADSEDLPSLIEATLIAARQLVDVHALQTGVVDSLVRGINEVLNEHRISYELIDDKMVEFESKELHQAVVAPTLRLLSGRPGWHNVESQYQDALREISRDSAADAITDAGTALQEAFKLLGCQGNSLGRLVTSARKKGLLAGHDSTLTDGIEKIANWVAADRSESGDSHKASVGITRDDAWFTVHVVGALILRLAKGAPRA